LGFTGCPLSGSPNPGFAHYNPRTGKNSLIAYNTNKEIDNSMETKSIDGLKIYYEPENADAAELVGGACEKTISLLAERWGLKIPADCRVYVMTSWEWYLWHSSPPLWKVLLAITLPINYFRIRKMWPLAGGWEQQYGTRHTMGVKTPELMEQADRSHGLKLFEVEDNVTQKVEYVTCHELTHAFVSDFKLPNWLKEGLSMLAVDYYAGSNTVREDTMQSLMKFDEVDESEKERQLIINDPDAIIYIYARGYWITRYLEETYPDLLTSLFSEQMARQNIEEKIAARMGLSREEFWREINDIVLQYFGTQEKESHHALE